MEINRAIEIIAALSDGVDPETGEKYPNDSPYQSADVVRALHVALLTLDKARESVRKRRELPQNSGLPWTEEEYQKVVEAYQAGTSIREIAKLHMRTLGGIRARLEKAGVLRNEDRW